MISDNTIQKVRDLDIYEVVGPYVKLTRRGSTYVGLCPFHQERTGSFTVNPTKNLYHCFSCGRGGDGLNFVMEKDGLTFMEAVEAIAKKSNIKIEYTKEAQTEEQIQAAKKRESLLNTLDLVQQFYFNQLRLEVNDEARAAREYAYGRWSEEFCSTTGIGYAPKSSETFLEYCKNKAIDEDLLLQLGILKKDKDSENIYPLFRERITIPIKNRSGKIIAFTCRYIGTNENIKSKYINSPNSEIYVKGNNLFGINKANHCKVADYFIAVEGAPDVLRMHQLGFYNTVAALGTAWTDAQFELLKRYTHSICFIPDTDELKSGEPLGTGFQAVMKNGAEAISKGFDVTVRELPYNVTEEYGPKDDSDLEKDMEALLVEKKIEAKKAGYKKSEIDEITLSDDEISQIPKEKIVNIKYGKNDADSYITDASKFYGLDEVPLIVWIAKKRFPLTDSLVEERNLISEISNLLRFVKDKIVIDNCITELAKIHGKPKLWRDALDRAKGEAKRRAESLTPAEVRERDIELLRLFNLSITDNCYFTFDGDDEPTRLSNFILEPLFHIQDESNGTRIFRMKNKFGDTRVIELREAELCSLSAFQQRVGSLGNFVWRAKIDKLNNVKEYTYAKTDSAERVRKMGWDANNELYAFGNGVFIDGKFKPVNDMGIISDCHNKTLYIPATSSMYKTNTEIFQFERLMVHENNNGVTLNSFATKLIDVFGENAEIALCFLISTIFRDVIFSRTRHFPILNLFGEKGTGKTTLATCLQSFFLHGIDPPNLAVTSIPAMNDRLSQAVNYLVVLDEYKNDLDVRKIAFLKGVWGGGGQTKKNTTTDGMAAQTLISAALALCGQDKPTQDMALYTRLIFLAFTKTSFTQEERKKYESLVAMCNLGLTHLTLEILSHRDLFVKNFPTAYSMAKSEFAAKLDGEEIHDRIFGNWVIPLATYRTLETVIDLPFSYSDLFEVALKGVRNQNEFAQESSEVADFWTTLQGLQTSGRCVEKAHYRIRYQRSFRALSMSEDMLFFEPKPILYLNAAAISTLLNARNGNSTANRSNWSTTLSYLKSHPSFLGLKQDRFVLLQPNGAPDYQCETVNGVATKKLKINRPKALCFDYSMLKSSFGLTLETEVLTEVDDTIEELDAAASPKPEPAKQETLPF